MDRIQMAKSNMEKFFGRGAAPLEKTDHEFAAIRDRLIYGQIASRGTLGDSLRMLVTLVSLTAGQNLDGFKEPDLRPSRFARLCITALPMPAFPAPSPPSVLRIRFSAPRALIFRSPMPPR